MEKRPFVHICMYVCEKDGLFISLLCFCLKKMLMNEIFIFQNIFTQKLTQKNAWFLLFESDFLTENSNLS